MTESSLDFSKRCTKCGAVKDAAQFWRLQSRCKDCQRAYYQANRQKRLQYCRTYHHRHQEEIRARLAIYRQENREQLREYFRADYIKNRDKRLNSKRASYEKNREKRLLARKTYLEENADRMAEYRRVLYQASREKAAQRKRAYYEANKEKAFERARIWVKRNPHKRLTFTRNRQANKLHATPAWANHQAIAELYRAATLMTNATGIKHHVDHIVPLRGVNESGHRVVSGLHVEYNLRVITAKENAAKGCKLC